jgi:hypothetical protein
MKYHSSKPRKSIALLSIICLALAACHKPGKTDNQINKIEIATGGGLKKAGFIAIQIDSTLTFNYYGGYNAKLKDYYSGKISPAFWDTLNLKLKAINFKKLDTTQYLGMDGQMAEVIFYWNNQKRHITSPIDEGDDSVSRALSWIANSYQHIELHKLRDTIKFGTTYQHLKPLIAIKGTVKFPPEK